MPKNGARNRGTLEAVPFRKLFAFANSFDAALMVIGTFGAAVAGVPLPLMAYFFGDSLNAMSTDYTHAERHKINQAALRCTIVGGVAAIGYFMQVSCWMITGQRQANRIRYQYLEALLRQDASFFDLEVTTGAALQSMTADSFHIQQATGEKLGRLIQICSTMLSGYAVAFSRGWKLTLVISALTPLILGTGYAMDVGISRTSKKAFLANGHASNIIEQVITAVRTVMTFTGEKTALQSYDKALKKADRASLQEATASGLGMGIVMFFTYNAYALTLWVGSRLIVLEGYSGAAVITVVFSVMIGAGAFGQCSSCLSAFSAGIGAAERILPVIYRVPEVDVKDETGIELEIVKGTISFENVRFAYPSRPTFEVFTDFSLTIPSGVTAALVGESGSGKSTVVSLIERFYDPQGGAVLIDGVNLKKLKLSWFRGKVGLVAQEPVLFGTTVRENILYGKEDASLEEIEAAVQLANASQFIASLPEGYDTMVGHNGLQLSGGQKQRIAIARTVLKDSPILLLDEATSSLDAESESAVHDALEKIMVNRTTVIVAHRLTTVKNADFIAVLHRGQIVEQGSHSELLSNPNGVFSQLVHLDVRRKIEELENEMDKPAFEAEQQDHQLQVPTSLKTHRKMTSKGSSRSLSFGSIGSIGTVGPNDTEKKLQGWRKLGSARDRDDEQNALVTCSHILRLAAHNRPETPILLLGCLASAGNGAILPVIGLLFTNIITTFYGPPEEITSKSITWVRFFAVTGCLSLVFIPLQYLCFTISGNRLIRRIRLLTFDRILHQEIAWFDLSKNASGVISSRLLRDAGHVRTLVGDALGLITQNVTTVVVGFFIAMSTCWQLGLLFVALLPFYGLDGVMQIKLGEIFDAKSQETYDETSRVAHEALASIRTVASFCAERKILKFIKSKSKISLQGGIRRAIIGGFGMAIAYIVMFGSLALSFWSAGLLISEDKVDIHGFLKTFLTIELSALAITISMNLAPDISNLKPAITSIFAMLDLQAKDLSSGIMIKRLKGEVEFQHVQFTYPSRPDVQIFHDLSFKLHAGMTLALVGESGGGKSTVLALLQRFYDLNDGQILLDRVDIKKLQIKWLRRQMGLVSQEPFLFNDTIRANIEYGIEGEVSQNEMQIAVEIANAHKFISSLPNGYESVVGERGVQLSGGQKQRVAIARAMVRDPKIVLLDEATSALDAESEVAVQEALEKATLGRSTIVVAHRLSTIRNADMIIYLKHGTVVEQGTHDELLRQENGLYATLVKLSMNTSTCMIENI